MVIWNKFVEKAINSWTTESGIVCAVHPAGWRKPPSARSKYRDLFKLLTKANHMQYLEIHSAKDGMKTFGAGTRYDWYAVSKSTSGLTTVVDENGKRQSLKLTDYEWLPNHSLGSFTNILGAGADVIYSRSAYGSDKKHTQKTQSSAYKHPLVHSTTKKGVRYYYSSTNNNGHFGISKVIFGDSGINDVIIDLDGTYGLTEHAMALPVRDEADAFKAKEFLMSDAFTNILRACSWSNFQIDWRLFTFFKNGFWRDQ